MGQETDRRGRKSVHSALLTALLFFFLGTSAKAVPTNARRRTALSVLFANLLCLLGLFLLLGDSAQAAPTHPRSESLDVTGLNHACGAAVDSKGDFYAASAGESKIKVYDASHALLTEISDANTPCGLAVTTTGDLYVSERATGEVVRFKPNAYPFVGTPTYGSREEIDKSGLAKGIAVDRTDDRLYVAEGGHVAIYKSDGTFEANVGEGTLTEATGVAAYTYSNGVVTERYLWAADAKGLEADRLYLFRGTEANALVLRRELKGANTPDGSFGFGAAGAYLAADPGNRSGEKCAALGEQACSAGHLFLYDAAHKALDEFDASGEYLDRTANAGFADAEPTAVAIDRSGGANDGTLYVTAGAGPGAKVLAFAPLKAPKRETLGEPLSHVLAKARSVATDSQGDVYAVAEGFIYVFDPKGNPVLEFEDPFKPKDIAVDSTGKVYVLDEEVELNEKEEKVAGVTYYTPTAYPPKAGTEYSREPTIATKEEFPTVANSLRGIAVNPGPGKGKDQLFLTSNSITRRYDSAVNNSTQLDAEFGKCVPGVRVSIAVNGANGNVYLGANPNGIFAINEAGTECVARFDDKGCPSGKGGVNPFPAVDQSNGHVIEYDGRTGSVHEYDAAGTCVAEFGSFTENLSAAYRVAVDSSCAIHEPPLNETTTPTCKEFDPANGNVYVAFDDTKLSHPPYDVNAFGPLEYQPPSEHTLTVKKTGKGAGTVTSSPEGIDCGSLKCTAKFDETKVITLTAKAEGKSKFEGWSGCEAEPSPTECEVTMSKDREVMAEFEKGEDTKKLTVKKTGVGKGTVTSSPEGISCSSECKEEAADFEKDSKVTLKFKADPGSEIVKWSGCEAEPSSTECEVTMTEDQEVIVEIGIEHPLLTVIKQGTATDTVTSEKAGINCGSTCSAKFDLGEKVILKATAGTGSKFVGWGEEDCEAETVSVKEGTCDVTMDKARQVTATFETLPGVIAKPAHPVLYDEATLRGEVDPAGLQTKYRFEYLTEEEYVDNGETFEGAQRTPVGELASGTGFVDVEAPVVGLEEGTEYRFRLYAVNSAGPAEDEGPPFATLQRRVSPPCTNDEYRTGLSANLPDCRVYELVTPAQTDGLTPAAAGGGGTTSGLFSNWLTVQQGEAAGERLAYFTPGTLPGFEGNGNIDGYRAGREAGEHPAGGWQSTLFSPSYREAAPGFFSSPAQRGVASDQLYSVWEIVPEPETFPETLPEGLYLRTPAGFEALGQGSIEVEGGKTEVRTDLEALSLYVSGGGTHVIFASKQHLESAAPPEGNLALYDRAAGSSSANVLALPPSDASEEEQATFLAALRSKEQTSFGGASEDGTAVVFKAGVGLYVRLDNTSTEKLSPNTAKVGDTLACAAGPLLGLKPGKQREFQWLRDATPIPGASGEDTTNNTDYATLPADEGKALQCLTVAKEGGTGSVAVSAPVEISPLEAGQPPRPPAQIAAPTPANPVAGTVESCNAGSWEDAESFAYQWYANGDAIAGANSQTYKVQGADVPGTLQCVVSGSNAAATVARESGLQPTSPAPAEAAPIATAQAAPKTTYAGTSEDGRYVFFALGEGDSPARLFRFDTQSESATEITAAGIFAEVSPDGTHAFFTSTEVLSGGEENDNGEEAEEGAHNLYAWEGTEVRFIGQLSAGDFKQNAFADISEMNLAVWTSAIGLGIPGRADAPTRSTPHGGVFVFQSHARLSAYDNKGVGEIYRYDPTAEEGQRLLCVSCDPSGASPSADALLEDVRNFTGGPPIQAKTMIASLTDNGQKVFFQSFDPLLPEDANEVEDVYEWMADGTGGCSRPGGCLALISSGQGETPSFLYAMSANGRDVFIHTKEKLVGADIAGSPSIYDAREGGGIPELAEPAPCQGDACQGQGSEAPTLPNPATTGAGESPAPPARQPCAKGKHRVKGRCVKRHVKKRHRRAKHNRRAQR